MFVVSRSYGYYEEYECHNICFVETEKDGEKLIEILKKLDAWQSSNEHIQQQKIAEYRKSLGFKENPNRPHKSTLDPHKLINQKDWLNNYIRPYDKEIEEVKKHNEFLYNSLANFKDTLVEEIPEEFKKYWSYHSNNYSNDDQYHIEPLDLVKF